MTNLNTPNGFAPRPLTRWNRYYIPQSDTNVYRAGDVVRSGSGTDAAGIVTVIPHPGSSVAMRGIIVSVDPGLPATGGLQANGQKLIVPAVKTRDYYVWVDDEPSGVYMAIDDGLTPANLVAASVGSFVNFTPGAGGTPNAGSIAALTSSTFGGAAGAGCFKVLGLVPGSSYGANAAWLVQSANHELSTASGPGGGGSGGGITALSQASDFNTAKLPAQSADITTAANAAAAAATAAGTAQTTATNAATAAAAAQTTASAAMPQSLLGSANGAAPLGSDGKLSASFLPSAVVGALNYQGTWNASTNSPALASGTGTKGQYYKVSTGGGTTLDGISSWGPTDLAIFDGTTWDKVEGAVTLAEIGGLGSNVSAFLATPSSANLLAVLTDKTGTGSNVFATAPTLSAPTLSGLVTTDGANITTASAMAALAIDVSKGLNTKSIAADSTFTFSAAPATANTWFSVHITNTDTNPHILTFPSAFSLVTQGARTTCPIAAGGQLWLMFRYDGAAYHVFGDGPFLSNFTATVAPAVTDDVSKGYGPGSMWGNTSANTFYWCESNGAGAASWNQAGGGGGSGTVTNTGGNLTLNALVVGAGGVDSKVVAGFTTDGTSKLTLGVAGTSVGAIAFNNATSGSQTISATTGALGTQTFAMPNIGSGNSATLGTQASRIQSKSAAYTTVLTDAGSTLMHPSADTTARTFTIDATLAWEPGALVAFKNQLLAGVLTIAITGSGSSLTKVGSAGGTGSRTLAAGGEAVAQFISGSAWEIIGGAELT